MGRCWKWLLVFALATGVLAETIADPTKRKGSSPLFRIHRDKGWGFMDRSGKTVIPPQFAEVGDFFSGLARARHESKCGYIDLKGRVAIAYQFDVCRDFSEGLAAVQFGKGWGFIDPTGTFVIQPGLKAVANFQEGLARFEDWDTIQCLAPYSNGEFKEFSADDAPEFAYLLHDGRSSTGDMGLDSCMGGRFGFLDHTGKIVIAPTFPRAWDFSEGRAAVRTDGSQYGFIDKTGKVVIEPQYDSVFDFSEGRASVGNYGPSGRFGYIDLDGTVVIPLRFDFALNFSEGLAPVETGVGQWGFIDPQGVFVIPPKFESAMPFSEGFAAVFANGFNGGFYVDRKGDFAFRGGLNPTWPFSDGLAIVAREKGWLYVDRQGKVVQTYEFYDRPSQE